LNDDQIRIRSSKFQQRAELAGMKRRTVYLALIVAVVVPHLTKLHENEAHDHHRHLEIAAAAMVPAAPKLPRDGWVATASSEDDPAAQVLDGNRATIWHSRWRTATTLPQWLTIDMRTPQRVSGLVYTPRSDRKNGRIGRYEIHLSLDGNAWGAPAITGTLADDDTVKTIGFAVSSARYVRLTALSEAGDRGP
jgi:galactose oxidase